MSSFSEEKTDAKMQASETFPHKDKTFVLALQLALQLRFGTKHGNKPPSCGMTATPYESNIGQDGVLQDVSDNQDSLSSPDVDVVLPPPTFVCTSNLRTNDFPEHREIRLWRAQFRALECAHARAERWKREEELLLQSP